MNRQRSFRLNLGVVAAAVAAAASAWAQDQAEPSFPKSLSSADVTDWLKRNTDLDPAKVISVTPSAVTGVLSSISTPEGPAVRQVNLRSESVSRGDYERDHVLSWTSVVSVDCKSRKARLGRTMAYSQRNLIGDGRETVASGATWIKPIPGGPAERIMLKVCDGKSLNPFSIETPRPAAVAQATPPKAAPAKPPAAKAPPPARPAPPPAQAAAKPPPIAPVKSPAPKAAPPLALEATSKPAPTGAGRAVAQVAASPSEAEARRHLESLKAKVRMPDGVASRVVKAEVGGKTVYRAQFAGFRTTAEAQAYCRSVGSSGCFVRVEANPKDRR
jgi:hypothetical protein